MIAIMVDEGDDWQNAEIPAEPDTSSSSSSSSSEEEITTTTGTASGKATQAAAAPKEVLHEEQLHQSG